MVELLNISYENLKEQKFRTILTLVGIVIGISSIVAMVSIGEGLRTTIEKQLSQLGPEQIIITPGGMQAMPGVPTVPFKISDVRAVEEVPAVEVAAGGYIGNHIVEFRGEQQTLMLRATEIEKAEEIFTNVQGLLLASGRIPQKGESGAVAIGWGTHMDVFENEIDLRDNIEIKNKKYKVVGIFEETGISETDDSVIMDVELAWDIFGVDDEYKIIFASGKAGTNPKKLADDIKKRLEKKRGEEDFTVMTSAQLLETVGEIMTMLNAVLGGIAGVALLVGGIGIMNTMLMTVIERTKEIGVMKAIGATRHQIVSLFLTEASIIGFAGGVLGVAVGFFFSKVISLAAAYAGISMGTTVTPQLALVALSFALGVSMISGIYPAIRAAKLNPIETLRYE